MLAVMPDSSLTSIPFGKTSTGKKVTDWVDPKDSSGEFRRQQSSFRNWISREKGAPFPAEKGRYHLYVSYACPWVSAASRRLSLCLLLTWDLEANRTLIARKLKGLEDVVSFSVVHWHLGQDGKLAALFVLVARRRKPQLLKMSVPYRMAFPHRRGQGRPRGECDAGPGGGPREVHTPA